MDLNLRLQNSIINETELTVWSPSHFHRRIKDRFLKDRVLSSRTYRQKRNPAHFRICWIGRNRSRMSRWFQQAARGAVVTSQVA